jgi:hypothetical protein
MSNDLLAMGSAGMKAAQTRHHYTGTTSDENHNRLESPSDPLIAANMPRE